MAARRMDGACLVRRNEPITLPAPSAVMKMPDQFADSPNDRARAGPSTRIGSAATVTAATMSSRIKILRSCQAMRKPLPTRDRLIVVSAPRGRSQSSTAVKKPNETAFSAKAQSKPTVVKMSTLKTGASARPRL